MNNRSPFLSSLQLVLLALFSGNDGRQFSLMNTTLFDQRWLNLHILLQYLCELFFEFGWIWLGDWSLLGLMFSLFGIIVLFLILVILLIVLRGYRRSFSSLRHRRPLTQPSNLLLIPIRSTVLQFFSCLWRCNLPTLHIGRLSLLFI